MPTALLVALLPFAQSSTPTLTTQTAVGFESGGSNYIAVACYDSSNAVTCYQDAGDSGKGKCVHLGRSGTTITAQTAIEIVSFGNYFSVAAYDSTNAVACFQDQSDSYKGKCAHVGRSGTSLTAQTAVEISGNTARTAVAAFDSTSAVACFAEGGAWSRGKCAHLGRSGTTLTAQTLVQIESGETDYITVAAFDSTNAVACFQDRSDSSKGKCVHLGLSGTTLTAQTAVEIQSATTTDLAVATLDSTNAVVCFHSSSGKCVHLGRSGTTLTAQTAVEIESGAVSPFTVSSFDSVNAVSCFVDSDDSSKGKCVHMGRSGTTLTGQTAVEIESGTTSYPAAASFDSTNAVACFYDGGASPPEARGKCVQMTLTNPVASSSSSTGDPHLIFHGGGAADFRGAHNKSFAFLAAPDIQVNAMTQMRTFARWNTQIVHGSFITRLFIKVRSRDGHLLRAAVYAEQWDSFRTYSSDDLHRYENRTWTTRPLCLLDSSRCEMVPGHPGTWAMQSRMGKVLFRASGWEVSVRRRKLRMPLIDGCDISTTGIDLRLRAAICAAPQGHWSRYFLDLSIRNLDQDPDLSAVFGRSTLGHISPHGIIGQSFDGSKLTVSGRTDNYGSAADRSVFKDFTTAAQAEGAIEGVYTDYMTSSPFSTAFKYARFDADKTKPIAPRSVSNLMGVKTTIQPGSATSAGVFEDDSVAVEDGAS